MAGKNQTSDVTQILLLTLFLCSVVFGGWGLWLYNGSESLRQATQRESANLQGLKELFEGAESKDVVLEYLRREESKKNSGKISSTINEIIESMKNSTAKPEIDSSSNNSTPVAGLIRNTYTVSFKPKPLREQITFLANIQTRAPHLGFDKVKLNNRAKNADAEEAWELTLVLMTYSGEPSSRTGN